MSSKGVKYTVIAAALASSTQVGAQMLNATDLLNLLVAEGVLSEEKAKALVEKARERSEKSNQLREQQIEPSTDTVRAPYVPQVVKDEIRDSVQQGMRAEVLDDVINHAKSQRWGIPNAQPSWVDKVSFSGDVRVRYQGDFYDDNNPPPETLVGDQNVQVTDAEAINDAGGLLNANPRDALPNWQNDQHQLRGRARLMVKAKPTEGYEVGIRLTSGDLGNPVSSNQTLGRYGAKWETGFDLAYIQYKSVEESIRLVGGRFKNPFVHTDMVWDSDMTFEGVAASWHWRRTSNSMFDEFRQLDPFVTVGAFPIKQINQPTLLSDQGSDPADRDIWLYGAQLGTHFDFVNQSRFTAALSYYQYENILGEENTLDSDRQDVTAPDSFQYGNTLQNIRFNSGAGENDEYYALASEYELLNATVRYGYAGFAPYHVVVTADYVKNVAYDEDEVFYRVFKEQVDIPTESRDDGYQVSLFVGWPDLDQRNNWNVEIKYRYLEGDAVLAAFADSDFLFGGTNAKGYILQGNWALDENVWASMKWISADQIDTPEILDVRADSLFIDINAKF